MTLGYLKEDMEAENLHPFCWVPGFFSLDRFHPCWNCVVLLWYLCIQEFAFWIPGTCVCSVCTILLLHTESPSGKYSEPVVHHKQNIDLYIGTTAFRLWFLYLDCSHRWTYFHYLLQQQNITSSPSAVHPQLDGKILFLDAWAHLLICRTHHQSQNWDGGHSGHPETVENGGARSALMLSQFTQVRRQRQQQGGMINWNHLFPPLLQRQNVSYRDGQQSE